MTSPNKPLNLASIGRELDRARQSRSGHDLEPVSESDESSSSTTSSPSLESTSLPASREEQPYPTCILCFTRPPSAVLLPCCHLNLCYLCAPLLLLKQCRQPTPPEQDPIPPITHRSPFNVALMKASANHPKSRRLSTGAPSALLDGSRGGEHKAEHIAESYFSSKTESGLEGKKDDNGRISLSSREEESGPGSRDATCLVCRATVNGWLRVYTG